LLTRLIVMTVSLLTYIYSTAQTTIAGTVKDKHGKPLSGISIALISVADTAHKWFTLSDTAGYFLFRDIYTGRYSLLVTGIGFKPGVTEPFAVKDAAPVVLPLIVMTDTLRVLHEVTILAKKQQIEIDKGKIVLNVQNDASASGSTAFDVLKKLPGVEIDQNENIILRGSSGVNILINGKMTYLSGTQLTNLLKGISADDINKMELNITPSADYDAAGNAGIIDIVLKKNIRKGYAIDIRTGLSKGKYWMPNENIAFSNHTKQFNFYGSLDYKKPDRFNDSKSGNTITDNGQSIVLRREDRSSVKTHYYTWHAGADWQFSSKHQLSMDYLGYLDDWRNFTRSSIENYDPGGTMVSFSRSSNDLIEPYYYDGVNLNYKYDIDSSGKKITSEVHYDSYRYNSDVTLTTDQYDAVGNFGNNTTWKGHQPGFIKIKSAKADAELPFTKFSIKAGVKYAEVKNDLQYRFDSLHNGYYAEINDMSNHFKYKERIAAAYFIVSKKMNKTSIDAGLRLEYTKADGYTVKQDTGNRWEYAKPFPSVSIEQQINDDNKINFSASRRINRPSYSQLNPIHWYSDPFFYSTGNPNLKPEMAWTLSTAYSFKQKYILTISYGYSSNHIMRTLIPDSNSATIKNLAANVGSMQLLDLMVSLPIRIFSFWQLQLTPDVSYTAYPISQLEGTATLCKWFATMFVQQQFKIPAGIKADVSAKYYTDALRGTYATKAGFYTDIGLKKPFLKNTLDVQLTATNVFNSARYHGTSQSNITDYYYDNRLDTRRVGITLHYHFGSDLIKGNNKATEEQERL
jgi:hypothetical protein